MTKETFFYWLKGFVEIAERKPTDKEWEIIVDHVKLVDGEKSEEAPYYLGHSALIRPTSAAGFPQNRAITIPSTC